MVVHDQHLVGCTYPYPKQLDQHPRLPNLASGRLTMCQGVLETPISILYLVFLTAAIEACPEWTSKFNELMLPLISLISLTSHKSQDERESMRIIHLSHWRVNATTSYG